MVNQRPASQPTRGAEPRCDWWQKMFKQIRAAVSRVSIFTTGRGSTILAVITLCTSGCARQDDLWRGGLNLGERVMTVEPPQLAVLEVDKACADYDVGGVSITEAEVKYLTLKSCMVLAVRHNRRLRSTTYATQRASLERTIAQRDLGQPFLNASYTATDGPNQSDSRVSANGRVGGFEIQPFVSFLYDEFSRNDEQTTSFGVAVSRQIFRIDHEMVRQYLPLTRATRDFHIAINERLLELRRLHLTVVELFYNIHRLRKRVGVRRHRAEDAQRFLDDMVVKVQTGMTAPVEQTNAEINLNQAQSDLVREMTSLQNAKEALLDVLGLDVGFELSIREDDLAAWDELEIDLESDLRLATQQHERVRNQMVSMEVQRQEWLVSRDELIPDVVGVLTASQDVEKDDGNVSLALSLTVPLDGYSAEWARTAQDRLRLMGMAVDLAAIRSDLERQLRLRHRNVVQFNQIIPLAQERLDAERRKLAATMNLYGKEEQGNLEVTRAKEAVDRAEVDLVDSQIGRIIEQVRYRSLFPSLHGESGERKR